MVSREVGRDNRRACVALRIGPGHNGVPNLRTRSVSMRVETSLQFNLNNGKSHIGFRGPARSFRIA
jgi:hypothetical protein